MYILYIYVCIHIQLIPAWGIPSKILNMANMLIILTTTNQIKKYCCQNPTVPWWVLTCQSLMHFWQIPAITIVTMLQLHRTHQIFHKLLWSLNKYKLFFCRPKSHCPWWNSIPSTWFASFLRLTHQKSSWSSKMNHIDIDHSDIWRFPEIGVPPNYRFNRIFPYKPWAGNHQKTIHFGRRFPAVRGATSCSCQAHGGSKRLQAPRPRGAASGFLQAEAALVSDGDAHLAWKNANGNPSWNPKIAIITCRWVD